MRLVSALRTLLLLILLSSSGEIAQGFRLDEFHSGNGGFSINAGVPLSRSQPTTLNLGDYILFGEQAEWESSASIISVSVLSVSKGRAASLSTAERPAVFAKWKAALLGSLSKDGERWSETPYAFDGFPGVELRSLQPQEAVVRTFFVKKRLFVVAARTKPGGDLTTARRGFDSFRLLTRDERILAMIAENSPAPLAQQRPADLPRPDSIDYGLQGAVRMVRDYQDGVPKTGTMLMRELQFDREGFLVTDIGFNSGYPDVITAWGWIAGKRVNVQAAVNYPDLEGPIGGRTTIISGQQLLGLAGHTRGLASLDYGNRFETKFDSSGRVIERQRYSSTGDLVLTQHFTYAGDSRTLIELDASGGFLSGVRQRLDKNLNVIETAVLSEDARVVDSSRYEYQFDSKGNWTVRKTIRSAPRPRFLKPEIVHRDIFYYEDRDRRGVG